MYDVITTHSFQSSPQIFYSSIVFLLTISELHQKHNNFL